MTGRTKDGGGAGTAGARVVLGGFTLDLLPERAVWWEAERTLFVADLHLGKDQALRAGGLPIPPGTTDDDLARLGTLARGWRPDRLVVLGDFLHARAARSEEVAESLAAWRRGMREAEVVLVRGNHDRSAGDPDPGLGIRVVEEPYPWAGMAWVHDPARGAGALAGDGEGGPAGDGAAVDRPPLALAGHLHPALRLGPGVRPPVFWLSGRTLVLPAFSRFTAGAAIRPAPGDRCWAVAETEVVEVPTTARSAPGPGRTRSR